MSYQGDRRRTQIPYECNRSLNGIAGIQSLSNGSRYTSTPPSTTQRYSAQEKQRLEDRNYTPYYGHTPHDSGGTHSSPHPSSSRLSPGTVGYSAELDRDSSSNRAPYKDSIRLNSVLAQISSQSFPHQSSTSVDSTANLLLTYAQARKHGKEAVRASSAAYNTSNTDPPRREITNGPSSQQGSRPINTSLKKTYSKDPLTSPQATTTTTTTKPSPASHTSLRGSGDGINMILLAATSVPKDEPSPQNKSPPLATLWAPSAREKAPTPFSDPLGAVNERESRSVVEEAAVQTVLTKAADPPNEPESSIRLGEAIEEHSARPSRRKSGRAHNYEESDSSSIEVEPLAASKRQSPKSKAPSKKQSRARAVESDSSDYLSEPDEGLSYAGSRPKRVASGQAEARLKAAVEKYGPPRSGHSPARSLTAENYERELEELMQDEAIIVSAPETPGRVKGKQTTKSTGMRRNDVDMEDRSRDGSSAPASSKRKRKPTNKAAYLRAESEATSSKVIDIDLDHDTSEPDSRPKKAKMHKTTTPTRQTAEQTEPRFTSPIHSRRNLQRKNYRDTLAVQDVISTVEPAAEITTSGVDEPANSSTKAESQPAADTIEIQLSACLTPRYHKFPRCGQCIAKTSGGICRFLGWRQFHVDKKTGKFVGDPFFENVPSAVPGSPVQYAENHEFNRCPDADDTLRMQETLVQWLFPIYAREMKHVFSDGAKHKPSPSDVESRLVCDYCASTVFGGSWFCRHCGKEYCLDCKGHFDQFHRRQDVTRTALEWERAPATRLLRCSGTKQGRNMHLGSCLIAVSRFTREELKADWTALAVYLSMSKGPLPDLGRGPSGASQVKKWPCIPESSYSTFLTAATSDDQPSDIASLQSHKFFRLARDEMDRPTFDTMWKEGIPIVVDNVGSFFTRLWTPESFISRTHNAPEDADCLIVDCQGIEGSPGSTSTKNVSDFFEEYKLGHHRTDRTILKLKDWPTYAEFRERFPDLYDDFEEALPVQDYTRRDGVLNIAAHFPKNRTAPDIGPKMYNAFAAREDPGGQGSTRLHMDMADAINVMAHANNRADGSLGCAVWDIFRPEDADGLRQFLIDKYSATHKMQDPIHSQQFYLDSEVRRELFEKTGIYSFRIYQYPGQAVMIPAGAAHQVCNLADCIKVACDFVSPHNVSRCEILKQEFRNENTTRVWKADVLQLTNMVWHAWTSCEALNANMDARPGLSEHRAAVRKEVDRLEATLLANANEAPVCTGMNHALMENLRYKETVKIVTSKITRSKKSEPVKPEPVVVVLDDFIINEPEIVRKGTRSRPVRTTVVAAADVDVEEISIRSPPSKKRRRVFSPIDADAPTTIALLEDDSADQRPKEEISTPVPAATKPLESASPALMTSQPGSLAVTSIEPAVGLLINGVGSAETTGRDVSATPAESSARSLSYINTPRATPLPSDRKMLFRDVIGRMADELIEAGSISDLSNRDVLRGILASSITRSGLVLPE